MAFSAPGSNGTASGGAWRLAGGKLGSKLAADAYCAANASATSASTARARTNPSIMRDSVLAICPPYIFFVQVAAQRIHRFDVDAIVDRARPFAHARASGGFLRHLRKPDRRERRLGRVHGDQRHVVAIHAARDFGAVVDDGVEAQGVELEEAHQLVARLHEHRQYAAAARFRIVQRLEARQHALDGEAHDIGVVHPEADGELLDPAYVRAAHADRYGLLATFTHCFCVPDDMRRSLLAVTQSSQTVLQCFGRCVTSRHITANRPKKMPRAGGAKVIEKQLVAARADAARVRSGSAHR